MRCWAVVPAAGRGNRLPGAVPKQYRTLAGRSLLDHALAGLLAHPGVTQVMVALSADDEHWPRSEYYAHNQVHRCIGGTERADSVLAALEALALLPDGPAADDAVLVHDAARALLPLDALNRLLSAVPGEQGALLALPAQDTLKRSVQGEVVDATLDRREVWLAQTPQYFQFEALRSGLRAALAAGVRITDEASCMEWRGCHPRLVLGDALNFKITTAADLRIAAALMETA